MRTQVLLTVTLAIVSGAWSQVDACGDKFLLVGRGARFQRAYAAVHPANILIYARTVTSPDRAIRDPQLHKSLRQAGHQVSVIEDRGLFEHALQLTAFDIVLADLVEAPAIDALIGGAPSRPRVLYVEYPTGNRNKVLAAQFACELKAGDRATRFLDKIDTEMKARPAHSGQGK